jgi:DNA segregation ATPase FtsK/SpoIIIE, S-DNA-T family
MRSEATAPLTLSDTGQGIGAFLRRQVGRLTGMGIFAGVAFALASLGTWKVADPSFSHATDNPVTNAMGYAGSAFSDIAMQFYGLSAVAALAPAVVWGILFLSASYIDRKLRRGLAWFGASLLFAGVAGCVVPPDTWPLPSGMGGVFGDIVLKIPALVIGGYPTGLVATALGAALSIPALGLAAFGSGLLFRRAAPVVKAKPVREQQVADDLVFDDEDEGDEGILALGAITHWWLSARAFVRRRLASRRVDDDGLDIPAPSRGWREAAERVEFAERAEARVSHAGRAGILRRDGGGRSEASTGGAGAPRTRRTVRRRF